MFTRILVPLDGTAESNAALPLARTVARATGGSIRLLRVPGADDGTVAETEARLKRVAEELSQSSLQAGGVVRLGEPADQILREIRDQRADLLIMRTHGRAGIERAVTGSVTQQVLSASDIPIVLMRPGGRRLNHVDTLLVPVDGSPGGAVALATAVGLAKASGATIRLVEAVVPIPMQVWAGVSGYMYYDPAWDEEAQVYAQSYVNSMVARLRENGIEATGRVREGPVVAESIVDEANATGADLIVMSTHALTGIARAVLGSVADAVVRTASCPVLVIHRVEGETETTDSKAPALSVNASA